MRCFVLYLSIISINVFAMFKLPRTARTISSTGVYRIIMQAINRQTIFCDNEDREGLYVCGFAAFTDVTSAGELFDDKGTVHPSCRSDATNQSATFFDAYIAVPVRSPWETMRKRNLKYSKSRMRAGRRLFASPGWPVLYVIIRLTGDS